MDPGLRRLPTQPGPRLPAEPNGTPKVDDTHLYLAIRQAAGGALDSPASAVQQPRGTEQAASRRKGAELASSAGPKTADDAGGLARPWPGRSTLPARWTPRRLWRLAAPHIVQTETAYGRRIVRGGAQAGVRVRDIRGRRASQVVVLTGPPPAPAGSEWTTRSSSSYTGDLRSSRATRPHRVPSPGTHRAGHTGRLDCPAAQQLAPVPMDIGSRSLTGRCPEPAGVRT